MPETTIPEISIRRDVEVEKIPLLQGNFLYHIGDRFFINHWDEESKKEVWLEIPPGEAVSIGEEPLSIPHKLFFGDERITLEGYDLFLSKTLRKGLSWKKRVFCNHVSFKAEPGTMTAIMGPSGAGKTILMNLLSGYTYSAQNKGKVCINSKFDVHRDRSELGRWIGYVPQDDTLIPQLTVYKSLEYCFQLRYADIDDELERRIITDACINAGLKEDLEEAREKGGSLLDTKIGSPDEKTLSGGQRKRVNIAHELIRNPLLLFLDEPTSGLSSVDADKVVKSLRALCDANHLTIILTIHQPSKDAFNLLDQVVILNRGGNLAYFGAAREAVRYFEKQSGLTYASDQNQAEFFLRALDTFTSNLKKNGDPAPAETTAQAFKGDPLYQASGLPQQKPDGTLLREQKELPRLNTSFWQQFWILLRRNQSVSRADKNNRRFQLLQPIAIAALMLLAFAWYGKDFYMEDSLYRVGYYFTQEQLVKGGVNLNNYPLAKAWAYRDQTLMGEGSANRRAAIFFLLIASSIWFGIINSCKEIVDERTVLRREAKSTLRISSYLAAKVVFLSELCCLQIGLLLTMTLLPNLVLATRQRFPASWGLFIQRYVTDTQLFPQISFSFLLGMFLILCATAIFASWLGLLISALAPTQKFALTVVPIIIIPQLLFGGLIRPIKDIAKTRSFMLTQDSLAQLKAEHLAEEIVERLRELQDQRFTDEQSFLAAVNVTIGEPLTFQFGDLIVNHARLKGFWTTNPLPWHIHDVMLQKWAFQAMLLYDAFGQTPFLQKVMDPDHYLKSRYVQVKTVKLIELFFHVNLQIARFSNQDYDTLPQQDRDLLLPLVTQRNNEVYLSVSSIPDELRNTLTTPSLKAILDRNDSVRAAKTMLVRLAGVVALCHVVLLLIPTYLWLRHKLEV